MQARHRRYDSRIVFKHGVKQLYQLGKTFTIGVSQLAYGVCGHSSSRSGTTGERTHTCCAGNTRLATHFGAGVVFDATQDFGTQLGNFVVSKRTFAAPEGEAIGQTAHTVAELRPTIDIKEFEL